MIYTDVAIFCVKKVFVDLMLLCLVWRWPIGVAGRIFLSCFVVNAGKLVRTPSEMALANVVEFS